MYKLSTSEFGIAQQYVHVQSVDVPDEVITYNAEGTALVYKEVDSSKGINRMVYPFLGANTSMTLYVENPGAYWIFVGNKRFYATAGLDKSDVQYLHKYKIVPGEKAAIKLFDPPSTGTLDFYMNVKVSYIDAVEGLAELADVTYHIFNVDGLYTFDGKVNYAYDPAIMNSILPSILNHNGRVYIGYPELLLELDSWLDIKISEVPNAIPDGTYNTNIDAPTGATTILKSAVLSGRVFENSSGKLLMLPADCTVSSTGDIIVDANDVLGLKSDESVALEAPNITIDSKSNNPYDAVKVKTSDHTTAENVVKVATSAPSAAPAFIGLFYIDKTAKKAYISVGTSSASDWKQITA